MTALGLSFVLYELEILKMRHGPDTKKIIAGIVAILLVVAAVFGGTAWFARREERQEEKKIRETSESPEDMTFGEDNTVFLNGQLYGFDHRIQTFLFVGTDNSGDRRSKEGEYAGNMSDFLFLMVLDYTDDSYGCIQIDRNTITDVAMLDGKGDVLGSRDMQICIAHAYGSDEEMSAENTASAVRKLLGELYKIDGYFVMGMGDIGALNSAVGGIDVTVPQDMTGVDPAMAKGATIHLDDKQAERFVRSRMGLEDSTNAARMTRQTEYMSGVFKKIRSYTKRDPAFGLKLFNILQETSHGTMTGKDFSRVAQMLLTGEDKGILRMKGETREGHILEDGQEHEEFYPEEESILEIMTSLYSLVPVEG